MDLLRHLSFFVAVAEEGHFGAAADRLSMTQPPLSQGLRRLETRLGVELLERGPRGVRMTDAGRELLPRARLLLADADRFRAQARALESSPDQTLRWGALGTLDERAVTGCVRALRGPHTRVVTEFGSTTTLIDAVRTGRLDLAVVEHPALLGDLASGPMLKLRRWVLVPDGHPAATAGQPRVRMLRDLRLVTGPRADNPPGHDLFVDTWRTRGLDPELVTAGGARELLALVAAGGHFGVTTAEPYDCPGVRWITLLPDDLAYRVRTVCRPGREFAVATAAIERALHGAGR